MVKYTLFTSIHLEPEVHNKEMKVFQISLYSEVVLKSSHHLTFSVRCYEVACSKDALRWRFTISK